jgi:hypothetical protein
MRNGNFDVVLEAHGHGVVNPPCDVQKYLPASVSENYGHYEDQREIDLYEAMLHAADLPTQRAQLAKHAVPAIWLVVSYEAAGACNDTRERGSQIRKQNRGQERPIKRQAGPRSCAHPRISCPCWAC